MKSMPLAKGQIAPDFTVKDTQNNEISLKDYKGKKLMLCFFRYAGCPFCSLQVVKLIKQYKHFYDNGLSIIAFFQSPPESIKDYIGVHNPQFPLISDPEKKIYNLYGVESSVISAVTSLKDVPGVIKAVAKGEVVQGKIDGDLYLKPAEFLIGPRNLEINKVHYGGSFGDFIPMVEIQEFLTFS